MRCIYRQCNAVSPNFVNNLIIFSNAIDVIAMVIYQIMASRCELHNIRDFSWINEFVHDLNSSEVHKTLCFFLFN